MYAIRSYYVSIAVKKLEEELGVALFERSKNAVRVTPVGEKVVRQAQKVLEQAEAVRELAKEGKDQLASPLRVGAIYTIGPYLFPQLIPQVQALAPQMPLYIEENFTETLRGKIRTGELDAIIIALPFHEPDVLTRAVITSYSIHYTKLYERFSSGLTLHAAPFNAKSLRFLAAPKPPGRITAS